jgi:NhaP-type Na+/H+ and K+/H+ antiporter
VSLKLGIMGIIIVKLTLRTLLLGLKKGLIEKLIMSIIIEQSSKDPMAIFLKDIKLITKMAIKKIINCQISRQYQMVLIKNLTLSEEIIFGSTALERINGRPRIISVE